MRNAFWESGVLSEAPAQSLANVRGARLIIADPPWLYRRTPPRAASTMGNTGSPADHYAGMPASEIAECLSALAVTDADRLALWHTWPKLCGDWPMDLPGWGRPVTGGAWVKSAAGDSGHYGPGYHWAGCSEPVVIYRKRAALIHRANPLRNAWIQPPDRKHSAKPIGWMRQWVRKWTNPGDLVLEPFAGTATACAAAALESRRFVGCEPDPVRFDLGLQRLEDILGPARLEEE